MPDFQLIAQNGVKLTENLGASQAIIEADPDNSSLEVSGGKLAQKNGGTTLAKMQNIATGNVLGRRTAGDGSPELIAANDAGFDGLAGKKNVSAKTAACALTAADSGKRFTNDGAGGDIQFTLPAAAVGLQFSFTVLASYQIDVIRAGTDVVKESDGTDKTHFQASTIGRTISITCTKAGIWTVDNVYGAWSML